MTTLERLTAKMPEGVDALLITSGINRFYVSKMRSSDGTALIFRDAAYFIIDFRYIEKAKEVAADELYAKYGVEIIPTTDSKAAAAKSELIVGETTARTPFIDKDWVKPHSAIVCVSHEANIDIPKMADVNVVDYWKQLKTFKSVSTVQAVEQGLIAEDSLLETGDLVLGKPCRTSDDQFIYACSLGLGALDITVAYELYKKATEMGIGTKVKLWDKPLWE